ncbi:MAG: hypothetical protein BGO69_10750 [Bacteroidetes bacterium 46-16]|nr:MAG: hypothetical protein BGO69_10750 [Bacteroidetes bacterium 46-16]
MSTLPDIDPLLTRHQAAAYINSTYSTLASWDCRKSYNLRPIKISRGMVRYRKSHLDAFLKSKEFNAE